MTMNTKYLLVGLVLLVSSQQGRPQSAPPKTPPKAQAGSKPTPASTPAPDTKQQQHQDNGSHIFDQNCSRCHNPPDGFSPRISGTIIRQMRICASLSAEEEKELLHFLNP
jgi:mono/diheme cytochrome c family protein